MVSLGDLPPEKEDIVFEDERDERAWVAFATGFCKTGYKSSINDDPHSAARFADEMLIRLRKRRKTAGDGPYRG